MLLGIPGDNTYSNFSEAQRAFWRSTVLPLISRMTKAFSGWLAPAYGGSVALKPDLDQVEGLAAEREALWARLNAATFLTVNEKRAAVGYAAVDIAPPDATPEAKAGYDPNQPRVPEGNEDGGQWTDGGGGASSFDAGPESSGRIRLAQAEKPKYTVNLDEEEANGGHTLKLHIAKNDLEVRQLLEARTGRFATISAYAAVESAFDSKESANDYVNRLLQENKGDVDLVAEGVLEEKWLTKRFGCVTGREAFRQGSIDNAVVRKTCNAGAFIVHDPRSPRGFRVITAYPFNDDTE